MTDPVRVTARLTLDVVVEVDADGDPTAAVGDLLTELGYHLDDWAPSVDGDHPDAVAWSEGGSASAPVALDAVGVPCM